MEEMKKLIQEKDIKKLMNKYNKDQLTDLCTQKGFKITTETKQQMAKKNYKPY
jgi:hypothetical protein